MLVVLEQSGGGGSGGVLSCSYLYDRITSFCFTYLFFSFSFMFSSKFAIARSSFLMHDIQRNCFLLFSPISNCDVQKKRKTRDHENNDRNDRDT